mmetsp:Transcript_65282/g.206208  ORF Transcript_65282/g.206208 Transcript_65282/m.206208 type:complete len:199 (-) Transcript_65282:119-715(-)
MLDALPDKYSSVAHITAAAAGGTTASLVRVPTEVIKQKMQMRQFPNPKAAVAGVLAAEGVVGLYAGYRAFLARDLPFDAIEFVGYEQMKLNLSESLERDLTGLEIAGSGAFAGALTGALTTPLDVIKTRLMVEGTKGRYRGVRDCVTKMVAEEGASSLFRGWQPRVMWIAVGGSVFFGALESSREVLMDYAASSSKPE